MSELQTTTNSTVLQLSPQVRTIAKAIDSVLAELGKQKNGISPFELAYLQSTAMSLIKNNLSDEYMKPIMELQGSKLGFLTDQDKAGGYSMEAVKRCVIEALMYGVQVTGNQFNIMSGKAYITKEGFRFLLKKIPGITKEIIPLLPIKENEQTLVPVEISWTLNGKSEKRLIKFATTVQAGQKVDATQGKAERKAGSWLYNYITGNEVPDADATEAEYVNVKPQEQKKEEQTETVVRNEQHQEAEVIYEQENNIVKTEQEERAEAFINQSSTIEELKERWSIVQGNLAINDSHWLVEVKNDKKSELSK